MQSNFFSSHNYLVPWELSSNAPVSIRAEGAWKVTRGSPEITVVIIDNNFDLSRFPANVRVDVVSAVNYSMPLQHSSNDHGTRLAELIIGSRNGYPGVAPDCRLVAIELPSFCTELEEAKAFDLALQANAAVICCGWGPSYHGTNLSRSIPEVVASSIDRVVRNSRGGFGAIVFFAVGSSHADVQFDGYVSHPSVTAVSGITANGQRPHLMDFGERVAFVAPVSCSKRSIGGNQAAPSGASGAAALATGVAGLVFSANQRLTSKQALSILMVTADPCGRDERFVSNCEKNPLATKMHGRSPAFGYGVLDGSASVTRARMTFASRIRPANTEIPALRLENQTGNHRRFRERRFIGGEHTYLGYLGAQSLQNLYHHPLINGDPRRALFEGMFAPFTPENIEPVFSDHVKKLLKEFFDTVPGPALSVSGFPHGKLRYYHLVGLAGDLFGSPLDMSLGLSRTPAHIQKFIEMFDKEMETGDESSSFALVVAAHLACGDRPVPPIAGDDDIDYDIFEVKRRQHQREVCTRVYTDYLGLAKKNYSHFAGDNLLFYLSYHRLAVAAARRCAVETSYSKAEQAFKSAIITEALAQHFLTDMFSAGHARVPRFALLYQTDGHSGFWDLVSKFLHDHEGRLGVFLRNAHGHVWYGYGDALLLFGKEVFSIDSHPLQPWRNEYEPISVAGLQATVVPSGKMKPRHLAANLVFTSLADVLRHMATGVSIDLSAQGLIEQSTGVFGYILERLPFALSNKFSIDVHSALSQRFGLETVTWMAMADRLLDVEKLYETYEHINKVVKARAFLDPWGGEYWFKRDVWQKYLQPENARDWIRDQVAHLKTNLTIRREPSSFLSGVPMLVKGTSWFPSTLVEDYDPEKDYEPEEIAMPESWKAAVPDALIRALTAEEGGVWGVDA